MATTVRVYFGTDRNRTRMADTRTYFGHGRAAVSYGFSDVTIPKVHTVGSLETPSILKFEFSPNPARHIVVASITSMRGDDFFSLLRAENGKLSERHAFVFVHGYANDFHEATRRAAQMKYDLNFSGLAMIYSWPSVGEESAYGADEDSMAWSTDNLRRFLHDLAEKSGAEEIFLIGHSMGTRGLAAAVAALTASAPSEISSRYKQLILAAPDIDRDIFKDRIFPAIKAAGMNVTLYASDRDKALDLSKIGRAPGRAYPRLGTISPSPFVAEGIYTIDAGPVDTSFWGHRYYAENRSIISDIYYLIQGVPVPDRFGIEPASGSGGGYWRFKQ
jgi:esterase/lipase superfamily enzyme